MQHLPTFEDLTDRAIRLPFHQLPQEAPELSASQNTLDTLRLHGENLHEVALAPSESVDPEHLRIIYRAAALGIFQSLTEDEQEGILMGLREEPLDDADLPVDMSDALQQERGAPDDISFVLHLADMISGKLAGVFGDARADDPDHA